MDDPPIIELLGTEGPYLDHLDRYLAPILR